MRETENSARLMCPTASAMPLLGAPSAEPVCPSATLQSKKHQYQEEQIRNQTSEDTIGANAHMHTMDDTIKSVRFPSSTYAEIKQSLSSGRWSTIRPRATRSCTRGTGTCRSAAVHRRQSTRAKWVAFPQTRHPPWTRPGHCFRETTQRLAGAVHR